VLKFEDYFNFADKLYLTEIDNDIEGDILLKGLDLKEWGLVSTSDDIIENGITYRFKITIEMSTERKS
jgi:hypothetical protein